MLAGLNEAVERLGFVQADPILSPARAQDLILRQRVAGYRVDDLEARYPELDVEEDFLYCYGFSARSTWLLLHPKKAPRLRAIERRVYEIVGRSGQVHPKDLEAHLGAKRCVNAWGGYSKETTRALEQLHWYGLLRVARREKGIRVYELARPAKCDTRYFDEPERFRRLLMRAVTLFAPAPVRPFGQVLRLMQYAGGAELTRMRTAWRELLKSGELIEEDVEGVRYVLPAAMAGPPPESGPKRVRALAPFDPLVWDRARFEHLWGWTYRFEAYTPPAKRKMGYYAMPLLWGDDMVGWVNARVDSERGRMESQLGFVPDRSDRGRLFGKAWEEEEAALAQALGTR